MSKKRTYRHATSIAPQAVPPSRRLSLSPDVRGGLAQPLPPTPDDISRMYGPAKTLGASEEVQLAMDARLADSDARRDNTAASGVITSTKNNLQILQ